MSNSPQVPKMRGVATFLNNTSRIDQLESIALSAPPQFIDPRVLVRSPYQPRTSFLAQEMDELEQSIAAAGGVKVPLIVRPEINEIIAGERRSIIAIKRGDLLVPVFWHTCTDDEAAEFAGFENVKRADLNAIDETNLVINMLKMRLKLADRQAAIDLIGQIAYQQRDKKAEPRNNVIASEIVETAESRNNVIALEIVQMVEKTIRDFTKGQSSLTSFSYNKLKLLNLPTEVVEAIRLERIEYTKAAEIGKIEDEVARNKLLDRAVEERLSVSQVKKEVAKTKPPKAPKATGLETRPATKVVKQVEIGSVDDLTIDSEVNDRATEKSQLSKVELEQSQPDLTATASQISIASQEEIDEKIQEMTETIRFKIFNDAYSLETKQKIEGLLDRVMILLN
jgi:ParB family transcriptional regulator, chromosome partitioning protein